MQAAIRAALGPLQAYHALDAISSSETWLPVAQVLAPGSVLSAVSGAHTYNDPEIPEGVQVKYTYVGYVLFQKRSRSNDFIYNLRYFIIPNFE